MKKKKKMSNKGDEKKCQQQFLNIFIIIEGKALYHNLTFNGFSQSSTDIILLKRCLTKCIKNESSSFQDNRNDNVQNEIMN